MEAAIPTAGCTEVEVYMPTWTPGSYLIREYERHVEAVIATAGPRAIAVAKSTKNRWKIATGGAPNVTLRYKVYSREMTVRNNWVEAGFAMLNGAPTFITLVERAARPHEVKVELPAASKKVETAFEPVAGSANTFRAADFDTLVDSPVIIGNPLTREFTVDGKRHVVLFEADTRDDRRRQGGGRRAEDRQCRKERDGLAGLPALSLPHYGDRVRRRPRAQEQLPRHGQPISPVNMSSYDTWIKQYRPDENTANVSVNYYPKGAVIAFLLDARIGKATSGARSLDTGMQWAMQRYSGDKGYTPDQFYAVMSEAAGVDLKGWFAKTAESTDELDYTEALDYYGLRFRPVDTRNARASIGGATRNDAGRLVISSVRRGTLAIDAGLNVDDEILAIDEGRRHIRTLNPGGRGALNRSPPRRRSRPLA